jgi:sulfide:quinone oxidoreductase
MATKTVILGGGVGGVVTANTLRGLLPREHEIVVIERNPIFHLGATKTWVMLGQKKPEEVTRRVDALRAKGITVLEETVEKIVSAKREVKTSKSMIEADFLVIALGADLNRGAIPGLDQAETFYTMDGAIQLGKVLGGFRGGDLVILNPRMPIKCPPAPYEVAFLLDREFRDAGIREKTNLSVWTAEPIPMPTAGPQVGAFIKEELAKRKIGFQAQKKPRAVDGAKKAVSFEDGTEAKYDLLISVLPHEAPAVVRDAGLVNQGGWIPVDPKTLKTSADRVWAIGDVTTVPLPGRYKPDVPLALPKAAVFAEAHGRVVAHQIAAHVSGNPTSEVFDGKGFCFVEFGGHLAMGGEGSFFDHPNPRVAIKVPDLLQYEVKQKWASSFLERNF